ncbi:hypothetical protein TSOC_012961 [Tetrabaena socialis]|uniref:Polycystin cation channel PKD1/PKD2 domain-containing protein n=1 Tax=Tetrabaena socialis TaxID=47790 RepID=A0A2J7ZLL9_9CHLO|nr:hypothetical protein TSOC_012961 [Tetrabaena socialis]|eukprot:PNH01163.1 hypothetical protein TSOC_012961 [Tetrabaena socialis]
MALTSPGHHSALHHVPCPEPQALERPPDNIAPIITILGTGAAYVTSSGGTGLITSIFVGDAYTDAGATALDEVPAAAGAPPTLLAVAVIPSVLDPSGEPVAAVSTSSPTGGGVPYLVTYSAVDGYGNAATLVRRRVYVLCRSPEFACPVAEPTDSATCSSGGICGLASTPAASGNNSSSSSSTGDSVLVPSFKLLSDPTIAIRKGAAYQPCRSGTTTDCEPGGVATLKAAGDLNSLLRACAVGVRNPLPYDLVGLQYCGIDTRKSGNYTITFHLTWPSVGEIVVYRTLVVEEACSGERTCSDGKCSVDGACVNELSANSTTSVTAAAANTDPRLTLTVTDVVGTQVSVKRGVPYQRCTAQQAPTVDLPCETLGTAADNEDGDLTAAIALCPPSDCASTQCRSHWADRKQPSECGVDTVSAAIGTTFTLQLAVYDSRGAIATAQRSLTVISPCATGLNYCGEALSGGGSRSVCSELSCEDLLRLAVQAGASAGPAPPRLFLLPSKHGENLTLAETNQTVFLAYRTPASFSLAPCANYTEGLSQRPCAAAALDDVDGDLTAFITTTVAAICPGGAEDTSCSGCSVAGLTTGACLPGRYRVTYSVANTQGLVTTAALDASVEQLTAATIELNLFPNRTAADSTNRTVADAFASALSSNATTRNVILLPILQVLGVASDSIRSLSFASSPQVLGNMLDGSALKDGVQPNYYIVQMVVAVTAGSTAYTTTSRRRSRSLMAGAGTYDTNLGPSLLPLWGAAGPGMVLAAGVEGSTEAGLYHRRSLAPVGDERDAFVVQPGTSHIASGQAGSGSGSEEASERRQPGGDREDGGWDEDEEADAAGAGQPAGHAARDVLLHAIVRGLGLPGSSRAPARRVAAETASASPAASALQRSTTGRFSLAAELRGVEDQLGLALALMQGHVDGSGVFDGPSEEGDGEEAGGAAGDGGDLAAALSLSHGRGPARRRHLKGNTADEVRRVIRRVLQTSSCGGSVAASSSSPSASGVASVGAVSTSCSSPSVDTTAVAMGVLAGAVFDLDRLSAEMDAQQASMIALLPTLDDKFNARDKTYRLQVAALSATANASFTAMYDKAQVTADLTDRILAQQSANADALVATLGLMQSALNEAEGATSRTVLTASIILKGLGDAAAFHITEADLAAYRTCVYSQGQGATFVFQANWLTAGNASAYTIRSSSAGHHRRRQVLQQGATGQQQAQKAKALRRLRGGGHHADTAEWQWPEIGWLRLVLPYSMQRGLDSAAQQLYAWLPPAAAAWLLPPNLGHDTRSSSQQDRSAEPQAKWKRGYGLSPSSLEPNRNLSDGGPRTTERSVLSSDAAALNGTSSGTFNGYALPTSAGTDYSLWEVRNKDRNRYVGLNNKVLVGLLMHQVRRTAAEIRATTGIDGRICRTTRFGGLVVGCDADPANDDRSITFGDLGGIGNDPTFNRFSTLYDSTIEPASYYNMTEGSPDLTPGGLPYGFHYEPLEQFEPGYPVMLDTRLSAKRAEQAITFVRDGAYLSSSLTKSLRTQIITFNSDAQVFGYWRLDFSWSDSGVITATSRILGLPAISYGQQITNLQITQFLPDFFLVLLIICYVGMTASDIYNQLTVQRARRQMHHRDAAYKARKRQAGRNQVMPGDLQAGSDSSDSSDSSSSSDDSSDEEEHRALGRPKRRNFPTLDALGRQFHPRMNAKWVVYELLVCALMCASIGMFYLYAVRLSVNDHFTSRFDVYDADTFVPARYFLMARDEVAAAAAAALNASAVPEAGASGRWALPAKEQPLNDAGAMFARVDDMYATLVTYNFLQGLVLAMVVLRWLHYISFQPRLSIIAGTLARALPDLLHFAVVVCICIMMFGAAAGLVFGSKIIQLSSFGESFYLVLKYVLLRDDDGVFKKLLQDNVSKSGVEWLLAGLLYVLSPIFFVFVISNFVLAFLFWPYAPLRLVVTGLPGVPQDIRRILGWYWQRFRHRAPRNKLLLNWLQAWSSEALMSTLAPHPSNSITAALNSATALGLAPARPHSVLSGASWRAALAGQSGSLDSMTPAAARRRSVLRLDRVGRPMDGDAVNAALHTTSRAHLGRAAVAAHGASSSSSSSDDDDRDSERGRTRPPPPAAPGAVEDAGAAAAAGAQAGPQAAQRRCGSGSSHGSAFVASTKAAPSPFDTGTAAAAGLDAAATTAAAPGGGRGPCRRVTSHGPGLVRQLIGSSKALLGRAASRLSASVPSPYAVERLQPEADVQELADNVMANLLTRYGRTTAAAATPEGGLPGRRSGGTLRTRGWKASAQALESAAAALEEAGGGAAAVRGCGSSANRDRGEQEKGSCAGGTPQLGAVTFAPGVSDLEDVWAARLNSTSNGGPRSERSARGAHLRPAPGANAETARAGGSARANAGGVQASSSAGSGVRIGVDPLLRSECVSGTNFGAAAPVPAAGDPLATRPRLPPGSHVGSTSRAGSKPGSAVARRASMRLPGIGRPSAPTDASLRESSMGDGASPPRQHALLVHAREREPQVQQGETAGGSRRGSDGGDGMAPARPAVLGALALPIPKMQTTLGIKPPVHHGAGSWAPAQEPDDVEEAGVQAEGAAKMSERGSTAGGARGECAHPSSADHTSDVAPVLVAWGPMERHASSEGGPPPPPTGTPQPFVMGRLGGRSSRFTRPEAPVETINTGEHDGVLAAAATAVTAIAAASLAAHASLAATGHPAPAGLAASPVPPDRPGLQAQEGWRDEGGAWRRLPSGSAGGPRAFASLASTGTGRAQLGSKAAAARGPGPVAEALEAASSGGAGGVRSPPRLETFTVEQRVLPPGEVALVRLVALVRALTAHLTAMLAQLLAAAREVEDMADLVGELLAAARSASSLADRRVLAAALRAVAGRRCRERRPLHRARELELPLPELELPPPVLAPHWPRSVMRPSTLSRTADRDLWLLRPAPATNGWPGLAAGSIGGRSGRSWGARRRALAASLHSGERDALGAAIINAPVSFAAVARSAIVARAVSRLRPRSRMARKAAGAGPAAGARPGAGLAQESPTRNDGFAQPLRLAPLSRTVAGDGAAAADGPQGGSSPEAAAAAIAGADAVADALSMLQPLPESHAPAEGAGGGGWLRSPRNES